MAARRASRSRQALPPGPTGTVGPASGPEPSVPKDCGSGTVAAGAGGGAAASSPGGAAGAGAAFAAGGAPAGGAVPLAGWIGAGAHATSSSTSATAAGPNADFTAILPDRPA